MTCRNLFFGAIAIFIILIAIHFITTSSFFLQFEDTDALEDFLNNEFTINRTTFDEVNVFMEGKLIAGEFCGEPGEVDGVLWLGCHVRAERPFIVVEPLFWPIFKFDLDTNVLVDIEVRMGWRGL